MSKKGFTLIEMLVVIGIIVILLGASLASFSRMTKSAERARAQEIVSNAATALTVYYQKEGQWPKRIVNAVSSGDGRLDENIGLILAKNKVFSLSMNSGSTKLIGTDRFGIVTPWAVSTIKRLGSKATEETSIVGNSSTIRDNVLHFSVDVDGNGVVKANVGGTATKIRATAAVWCIGKSGGNNGTPWPYAKSSKHDDIYSWTPGQTKNVIDN